MNLRIDQLLAELRHRTEEILQAIDADPLLIKKHSDRLVLANAGKQLFTPTDMHHLFAKGIVYRREPYQLVSMPLIKIYNLNERDFVSLERSSELVRSAPIDRPCRLHFLRKFDGAMIQRFQEFGRVAFTTRGGWDDERTVGFDFTGAAKGIAREQYPVLLEDHPDFEGLTLIFELIHPETRVVTNYGDRKDILLLAVMDRREYRYWTYHEVQPFATKYGIKCVDVLEAPGATLSEQITAMLERLAGTDQEGAVLTLEFGNEVIYRVKVKSPDYLRLLRLMVDCTYDSTADLLDQNPQLNTWDAFRGLLQSRGTESVPEELLNVYRDHFDTHHRYLRDLETLLEWAERTFAMVRSGLAAEHDPRMLRKRFAVEVQTLPHNALLFAALDGRLDMARVRKYTSTPEELRAALISIDETPPLH